MHGGHAAGSAGEQSPAQAADMMSRLDALYAEHDAILAEFGFVYREPASLTGAQMDRMTAEMDAAAARYEGVLDEVRALARSGDPAPWLSRFVTFWPVATQAAVYQLIADERDEQAGSGHGALGDEYGYLTATPEPSAADGTVVSEGLADIYGRIGAALEDCPETHCTTAGGGGNQAAATGGDRIP